MNNTGPTTAAQVLHGESAAPIIDTITIRVSPNSYFIALFLLTFITSFLIYLEKDVFALLVFVSGWIVTPYLAWNDRIAFDGKCLTRTGLLPKFWAALNRSNRRLKISDIEQVETFALRAIKRGGNVFYRYRTSVKGKNIKFDFASGGEEYRQFIRSLFSVLPVSLLDNRSIELRDFLREPKETLMKAEFAKIPSAEVLTSSLKAFKQIDRRNRIKSTIEVDEKADYLHRLANELRLAGYLPQSLEAFRRALFLSSRDAWLIFDFARCLHSYAGSESDKRLTRRAFAALRLAEARGCNDAALLARIGETYFQFGDWKQAQRIFQKAKNRQTESFRSTKGLAEIALREGKIAYVIQYFSEAANFADTSALKRWTNNESEYFTRLNEDENYMEMELNRVKLLENLEDFKKTSLHAALLSIPAIILGMIANDDLISNIGWSISSIALLVWVGMIISYNVFSSRIPLDHAIKD